jgi:hypothetical protein
VTSAVPQQAMWFVWPNGCHTSILHSVTLRRNTESHGALDLGHLSFPCWRQEAALVRSSLCGVCHCSSLHHHHHPNLAVWPQTTSPHPPARPEGRPSALSSYVICVPSFSVSRMPLLWLCVKRNTKERQPITRPVQFAGIWDSHWNQVHLQGVAGAGGRKPTVPCPISFLPAALPGLSTHAICCPCS